MFETEPNYSVRWMQKDAFYNQRSLSWMANIPKKTQLDFFFFKVGKVLRNPHIAHENVRAIDYPKTSYPHTGKKETVCILSSIL